MKNSTLPILIAIIALTLAGFALFQAKQAGDIALSHIEIVERNTLITPVFDESTEKTFFLAIFELGFTNMSGPDVDLVQITNVDDSGFVVALNGSDVTGSDLDEKIFLVEPTLAELQKNPKLIPTLPKEAPLETADVMVNLKSGTAASLRLGIMLEPYGAQNQVKATMALISFKFAFSNGKTWQFRRGVAIPDLESIATR